MIFRSNRFGLSKNAGLCVFFSIFVLHTTTQPHFTMETLITNGIKISVQPYYVPEESAPIQQRYIHAYRITIENMSSITVQLLERHWVIVESNGLQKEVRGQGVVGEQPIVKPGERFEYSSWCPLVTDFGKMYGSYTMLCINDGSTFQVKVPRFLLHPPFKMN